MLPVRDIVLQRQERWPKVWPALIHAWEASPSGVPRRWFHFTRKVKGSLTDAIIDSHSPGKEMKALSTWKSPWVHPSPKGRLPVRELLFQGKLHMVSVRDSIYNQIGLGLIIVHSHGLEISGLRPLTGRRCNLLTKGICTSYSLHCGGQEEK